MSGPVERARTAWDNDLPEWIEALAAECEASSQNRVALRLGVSASMVSQVLARKYRADMTALEERFLGAYRGGRVVCPALGLLPLNECRDWRVKGRSFAPGNPLRVRMYRACARCPRNATGDEEARDD